MKAIVNKRAITWLLAALLAIAANAAVPVLRARAGTSDSAIVWIAQDQAEQQVLGELRRAAPQARGAAAVFIYQPPAKARQIATSLYQRPPPSLR